MKYLFLLIVIAASIGTFVVLINPEFQKISGLRSDVALYQERLQTAQQLQASREQLIATYNSIQKTDLDNLKTLLPDSVDNIRLIIQLNALALQNSLSTVRDVQYDPKSTNPNATPTSPEDAASPYGTFQIVFTTSGQYKNFLAFLSDMEQNLRMVDVVSVDFTPTDKTTSVDNQQYKVLLKTYWLKQL